MLIQHMLRTGLLLAVFAIIGTGLVAITFISTEEPIAKSERDALLRSLHDLVTPDMHNNDLFTDIHMVTDRELLGSDRPLRVFRARQDNKPIAVVIESVAPDGYSGNIHLLVAIRYDGLLLGVRVVKHRETPGLGDAIEIERSDWINGFAGRSLGDPDKAGWQVKKDGGEFDQFTGATISPRAIVKAIYNCLQYYKVNRELLFAKAVQE